MKAHFAPNPRAQAAAQLAVIVLKVRLGIGGKDDGKAADAHQGTPLIGGDSPAVSVIA